MMNEQRLMTQGATVQANRLERRTLDGRAYAVAPVVALVAGVVNGMLAPVDEIAAFVEAWNGRPVSVRHPQRGNAPTSANDPDVVAAQVLGTFYRAAMEGNRLKGELWIDEEKTRRLPEGLALLERLDAGRPVEVSTAYFCDLEVVEGVFNGRRYEAIQRNLRPDHVALLPDEIGACSWADGCGAPRVNQREEEKNVMVENQLQGESRATEPVTVNQACLCGGMMDKDGKEQEMVIGEEEKLDLPAAVLALAELVEELGGVAVVRDAIQSVQVNSRQLHEELVMRLVGSPACAFSREEMEGMPLVTLEKLERSLRPADYSGRGGVRANSASDEVWVEYLGYVK